ncbi:MAG: class I SAM-dependent methyltransferase [Acidobacteriota bacterium]|nr:class I SAM-dependent methyltransferase [Acidobacteriota bacterium]
MALLEKTFSITEQTRVLDVGGSPDIWAFATVQPQLTILNFPTALLRGNAPVQLVAGDGCQLPFKNTAFDLVFSNSVIEHVGSGINQQRFAEEIARVARSYWVQTPNRGFPFEQHMMLPFVHQLPKRWQRPVVERITGWELIVRPSKEVRKYYVNHFLNELKLLSAPELSTLFPDAKIVSERTFGIPKSLIAVRRA